MAEIQKLNKTFQKEQVLTSDEMNTITSKIDEVIQEVNSPTNAPKGGYNRALFEAAGAVYNEATGFYELNGLTDITEKQMTAIYEELNFNNYIFDNRFPGVSKNTSLLRTNIPSKSGHPQGIGLNDDWRVLRKWAYLCVNLPSLEVIKITANVNYVLLSADNYVGCDYIFYGNPKLKTIEGIIDISKRKATKISYLCSSCPKLESVNIYGLISSIDIKESPLLSKESILYMVQNSAATAPITITLHADAYAMAMANAEIQAALQQKTNVSLASA